MNLPNNNTLAASLVSPIALACAVLAGIGFMVLAGAPAHYALVNGAALVLTLLLMRFAPKPSGKRSALIVAAIAVGLLYLPLLTGPKVDGIARWIGLGPVNLHAGMLTLPILMGLLPRLEARLALGAVTASAIAVVLQPDFASALALSFGTLAIALQRRNIFSWLGYLVAGLAVFFTASAPPLLEPIAFVEHVFSDAWKYSPVISGVMASALAGAIIAPTLADRRLAPASGAMFGFTLASFLGAYPVPLLGYGAAAILGYGLALTLSPTEKSSHEKL